MLVYLREAHPKGGWEIGDWSEFPDPVDEAGRRKVAQHACKELSFAFPCVTDTMDDRLAVRWSGWPERLFVVSKDGHVVYAGDQGPFGFHPAPGHAGLRDDHQGLNLRAFLEAWRAR